MTLKQFLNQRRRDKLYFKALAKHNHEKTKNKFNALAEYMNNPGAELYKCWKCDYLQIRYTNKCGWCADKFGLQLFIPGMQEIKKEL